MYVCIYIYISCCYSPKIQLRAKWSDGKLAVLLFPNMTRTWSESYEAFGYVHAVPTFSMVDKLSNQLVGSLAMWLVSWPLQDILSL